MSEFATNTPATQVFRPRPDHNPRARADRYRRVHYYVSEMAMAASGQLKQALLALRNAAPNLATAELQAVASKQYTEEEFLPATKELLCIWMHLEAVDQGGEMMPAWVMNFLKLALYATDYLIPEPKAMAIMDSHADCRDLESLYQEVSETMGSCLGFAQHGKALASALVPLLTNSRPIRQKLFKSALVDPMDFG
jgi:hypothetical protein